MKQTRKVAIAASAFVCAAMFSFSWSEQSGVSLSVDNAQAQAGAGGVLPRGPNPMRVRRAPSTRVVVRPGYYPRYYYGDTKLSWHAVRAYYDGGPWCPTTTVGFTGYGYGYGTAGDLNNYTCYNGWDDYAKRFGISCTPGHPVKGLAHPFLGGDGILYACQ